MVSEGAQKRSAAQAPRNDPRGQVTEIIAEAFTHLEGFEITRSARRCVSEPEAADKWRSSTREAAARAMQDWNAELAIMGAGQQSDQSMNVWFVRQDGTTPWERVTRNLTS